MIRILPMLAALVATLIAMPAAAKDKGPPAITPDMGFVLVRVGPTFDAKGTAPNVILQRIDPATSRLRTPSKKDANPVPKGEGWRVVVGGRKPLGSEKVSGTDGSVYLVPVTPGEWAIVGTESTCFCMGSYRFTVKPGEMTDIGTIVTVLPESPAAIQPFEQFRGQEASADLSKHPYTMADLMFVAPAHDANPLPAAIAANKRTKAQLIETRFDNSGGWMVNRMSGLSPMGHESAEAAAAVSDPNIPAGTSSNRWPDIAAVDKAASTPAK